MLPPFPRPASLYPLKVPHQTRRDDNPMQILALGLSRTGTDSLRTALGILGHKNVYHGFAVAEQDTWTDARAWYTLLDRKFNKGDTTINAKDLDVILGDFSALCDIPAVMFATELLDAYPQAAVILNKRSSMEEWKGSFRRTTLAAEQGLMIRFLSYFNVELFWVQKIFETTIFALFHNQFESNVEAVYRKHYEEIETKLRADKRPYLDWYVRDGWTPLCDFLRVDVPQVAFPARNAKQEHDKRMAVLVGKRVSAAMATAVGITLAVLILMLALWYKRR